MIKKTSISKTNWFQFVLLISTIILYVFFFNIIFPLFGSPGALLGIPVIIAGWFYGLKFGVIAGFVLGTTNLILVLQTDKKPFLVEGLFIGTFSLIIVGAVVGRLHDLQEKLKIELQERMHIAKEYKKLQHQLEGKMLEQSNELAESELLFSTFMDQFPGIAYIKNADGQVQYKNRYMVEFFEIADEPALSSEDYLPSDHIEAATEDDILALTQGHVTVERWISNKNGEKICFEVHKFAINRPDREPLLGGISFDITEKKKATILLNNYNKELVRSNQELQSFAYVASHDLQEPLRKIRIFSNRLQALCEGQLDEKGHKYLSRLDSAAKRMQILIEDLLTFSQVFAQPGEFKEVDLTVITQEVVSDLEVQIEAVNGRIEINSLPTIEADPTQMRQLMQNLISNALKFQQKESDPKIIINGKILLDHELGEPVGQITIHDNGIGIASEHHERIFGVFERLHNRNLYGGTGIGLSICQRVAERHRGTIDVQSEVGKGTTFTINLPRYQLEHLSNKTQTLDKDNNHID